MSQDKRSGSAAVPATKRYWISALLLVLGFSVFAYYRYMDLQDRVISQDYYRILYEASNHFNENLIKLNSLYQYDAGVSALRSLFPSFRREKKPLTENTSKPNKSEYVQQKAPDSITEFRLSHYELTITTNEFIDRIQVEDILPFPEQGFSQYLFADSQGIVLTSSGDEKSISVVDLTSIKQALHQQQTKWRMDQQGTQDSAKLSLPSLSRHIDMTLSHGEYRVFLYPFRLETALTATVSDPTASAVKENSGKLQSFYLVGLLPKHQLSNKESGGWNLSMLIISLVSLIFVWLLLRLLLMPLHHSISRLYRYSFYTVSYTLFILLGAWLLASLEHRQLRHFKAQIAADYALQISGELKQDLQQVFTELEQYKSFYRYLVNHFLPLEQTLRQDCKAREENERPDFCAPDIRDLTFYGITSSARWLLPKQQQFRPFNYQKLSPDSKLMDIYHQDFVHSPHGEDLSMFLKHPIDTGMFKSIFTINPDARLTLPSIYFYENGATSIYDLSHRDYFKQARDMRGFNLPRADGSGTFEHIYIQRLLNIDNGTRGTTISMPLYSGNDISDDTENPDSFVLGADIILPSVSLRAPHQQDLIFMVVNRRRGQVLFHTHSDRSLTENIFHLGDETSTVARWLKAGLDSDGLFSEQIFSGHYHGQSGQFTVHPAPIDEWAVLVFYPDSTLRAHQFTQFLFYAMTMGLMLLLCWLLLLVIRIGKLSAYLQKLLPKGLHVDHGCLFFSLAIYISAVFWVVTKVMLLPDMTLMSLLLSLVLCFILICTALLLWARATNTETSRRGRWLVILVLLVFIPGQALYLAPTSSLPVKNLLQYYHNYHCAAWNQELSERHKIALNNYPNSVTHQRLDPQSLLPVTVMKSQQCKDFLLSVNTDDYPALTTLSGFRYAWQWLKNLAQRPDTELSASQLALLRAEITQPRGIIALYLLLMLLLPVIWVLFHRNLLWQRLDYPPSYLSHLRIFNRRDKSALTPGIHPGLTIQIATPQHNGIHLSLLLGMTTQEVADELIGRFTELMSLCPQLMACHKQNQSFSNLKINLKRAADSGALQVELWDIESSLEQPQQRQCLLELIMQLKSLVLLGKLHGLRILTEFHTLNRIRQKKQILAGSAPSIGEVEYLSWAECLMDFRVLPPKGLLRALHYPTLEKEIAALPELGSCLSGEQVIASEHNAEKDGSPEQTIKLLLILADALYRFKWESCSNVEKLALYHLAKGDHLNPLNKEMIEQLLLDGLIKITDNDIQIANQSFRQFILNAEPKNAIAELIHQSEAGTWKNYRLPIGLLIIIIIGGMAITSGQSIPIIIASVAGVMGTLASLANSANLLRGQIK
ncbi:hypothetical protein [Lacimicrobium alkaliphilum]|uniref:Uncharacterized protein n=1 Tax=Lacimicrobium alkaliphilum TaxID=1526571 RepID=A0ABQ1RJQ0_9ALTE|nr:hypothetical protein [Lacimicrobium alkaliphilum]GGD69291.1 hypothetical protein GCM10011357_25440 [Lacimicrobium alkaliphilum]